MRKDLAPSGAWHRLQEKPIHLERFKAPLLPFDHRRSAITQHTHPEIFGTGALIR
jgi:hypothetical protein